MGRLIKKLLFAGVYMGVVFGGYGLYDHIWGEEPKNPAPVVKPIIPVNPKKPIVKPKNLNPWKYEKDENERGFSFCKKVNDTEISYRVFWYINEDKRCVERPSIKLTITKYKSGYDYNYLTFQDEHDGYGNKLDGNLNYIYFDKDNKSGSIYMDDRGNIGLRYNDFKRYSNENLQRLLAWGNRNFKEVQDELRTYFGDKINPPKEGEELPSKSIDDLLKDFK